MVPQNSTVISMLQNLFSNDLEHEEYELWNLPAIMVSLVMTLLNGATITPSVTAPWYY